MTAPIKVPRGNGRRQKITLVAAPGQSLPAKDARHLVEVRRGRIDQAADEAQAGLFHDRDTYFQRGEVLVRKASAPAGESDRPGEMPVVLVTASQPMVLDDLERTCRFVSVTENADTGEVRTRQVACPPQLPGVILGRAGRLPVPQVRGIAELPQLHADGSIVRDGYDARSRVVVVAPGRWPRVPERPSDKEAHAALAKIKPLIADFPFVSDLDLAVMLAAMLSAVLRPTLPACPAFAWSSPVRGSGKSKLADVVAVIATGRQAPALTWPPQEDEAEKRLGAAVMSGEPVLLLDNIETALRGACLNSLLTQPVVSLRLLGRSQLVRAGAAVLVLATGNNLVLLGDLSRRFLVSHLDPHTERPELRRFAFDPVAKAMDDRRAIVTALLTIARWGYGREVGLPPLGSFEAWSRRVRDPLVALGLPDCCGVLEELHKADPEREAALEVLGEWRRAFNGTATPVAAAIRAATHDPALRDALDAVAGGPGGISPKRLGKYLARIRDRVFSDMVLRQHRDLVGNVASWAVESSDAPGYRVNRVSVHGEEEKAKTGEGPNPNPANPVTRSADAYRSASQEEW